MSFYSVALVILIHQGVLHVGRGLTGKRRFAGHGDANRGIPRGDQVVAGDAQTTLGGKCISGNELECVALLREPDDVAAQIGGVRRDDSNTNPNTRRHCLLQIKP